MAYVRSAHLNVKERNAEITGAVGLVASVPKEKSALAAPVPKDQRRAPVQTLAAGRHQTKRVFAMKDVRKLAIAAQMFAPTAGSAIPAPPHARVRSVATMDVQEHAGYVRWDRRAQMEFAQEQAL